ncbi:MAG: YigZ family protein [Coriobacteriales bacterium]|nr:YigZ family protein [Coriobacteriales bacterium]
MPIPLKPLRTVEAGAIATSEFEDRKSVFYGHIAHVESEREAIELRHSVMAQIPEASHYISAYIIREPALEHYSDAKEPHGTAGLPVLNVLKSHGLEDVACVVARVFGGTLLGKGGLMRAYTKAAQLAVAEARIVVGTPCNDLLVSIEYPLYEPLRAQLEGWGVQVLSESFAEAVTLELRVAAAECELICERVRNLSSGRAEVVVGPEELAFLEA